MGGVVAAEFCAYQIALARNAPQGDAEQNLAHASAIEGRGVDEVHAGAQRSMHRAHRLIEIDVAELLSQRGGPEADDGQVQPGFAKCACLHKSILLRVRAALQTLRAVSNSRNFPSHAPGETLDSDHRP